MGIDVNLYVEVEATDDELAAAEVFMQARVGYLGWGRGEPLLRRRIGYNGDEARIEVDTGERYYSEGYPRGDWPTIYTVIRAMRAAFPTCQIFYGGDHGFEEEATDDLLEILWRQWLADPGEAKEPQ